MRQGFAHRTAPAAAFTLMEVIVAMVVVSVLMAALYASFRSTSVAERSGTRAVEDAQATVEAIQLLRADLLAALPPSGQLGGRWFTELAADGSTRELTFNTNSGIIDIDYTGLTNADLAGGVTSRWPPQAIGSDAQRVTWLLSSSAAELTRGTTRNVLATEEQIPRQHVVLRDVQRFTLRYYDGQEWREEWDSDREGEQLPIAVEIILEVRNNGAGRAAADGAANVGRRFTTVVQLPMSTMDEEVGGLRR